MARPRVFISSTYYDLKHIRASIEDFVESLGFEPIMFERGDIAYSSHSPLDESCYREAQNADIFVLIIGGSYGSATSDENSEDTHSGEYESITKKEFKSAIEANIPSYILIDSNVQTEHKTYKKNAGKDIEYAFASIEVFKFIDEVLALPMNNPVHGFDRYYDIENWLKEQWAGLFKELLRKQNKAKEIETLTSKVKELGELNKTLKRYLEALLTKEEDPTDVIKTEDLRLSDSVTLRRLEENEFYKQGLSQTAVTVEQFYQALTKSSTIVGFRRKLSEMATLNQEDRHIIKWWFEDGRKEPLKELNLARRIVAQPPYEALLSR